MVDSPSDGSTVACECGTRLKVPASAAGKKAKCPKCGSVFVIQIPQSDEASTYALSSEPDAFSLMNDLAQAEKSAAPLDTATPGARSIGCPKCGEPMPADARVCVACGYDRETGRTHKVSVAKPKRQMLPTVVRRLGGFMLGTLLSGVGAMIGAGVWFAVAMSADMEHGIIAWGVGVLAGVGMWLGYRGENLRAGVTAAAMSLFGILIAKVLIFVFVILAFTTGDTSNVEIQRAIAAADIADKILDDKNIWDEAQREENWEDAYAQAMEEVNEWSDDEVRRRIEVIKGDREREAAMYDEGGQKKIRIAQHRADRRAEEMELAADDRKREQFYAQEFAACKEWEEAQLDAAIADIDTWEKEGRWNSEKYVRAQLIVMKEYEAIEARRAVEDEKKPDDDWEPNDRETRAFHTAATNEVEAMSVEDRVESLRSIEAKLERERRIARLAIHHAEREAKARGLSYIDPQRGTLNQEAFAQVESMGDDEMQEKIAALDEWEAGGKWSDEDYVHDHLVYELIRKSDNEDLDEDDEVPFEEKWSRWHADAVEKVEAIPAEERAAYAKNLRSEREAEMVRAEEEAESAEIAQASSDAVGWFFSSMFGFLDVVFVVLAVSSAFGIATRGLGSAE